MGQPEHIKLTIYYNKHIYRDSFFAIRITTIGIDLSVVLRTDSLHSFTPTREAGVVHR